MKIILANWKMNGSLESVEEYCDAINFADFNDSKVILALPDIFLQFASTIINKTKIRINF